jgi:hypothetical protein
VRWSGQGLEIRIHAVVPPKSGKASLESTSGQQV